MEDAGGEKGEGGEVAASAKRHSKIRKRSKRWESLSSQSTQNPPRQVFPATSSLLAIPLVPSVGKVREGIGCRCA